MKEELIQLARTAQESLEAVSSEKDLETLRIHYLGRKGILTRKMKEMRSLSPQERPAVGRHLNTLKVDLEKAIRERKASLGAHRTDAAVPADLTLPGLSPALGTLHPITQVLRRLENIFISLGFEVVSGPEIETEYYNFEALNIPLEHPARESFDTFYLSGKHLLRSQTSTVQIRVMENRKPPLAVIAPGRVFRPDATDATHSFMFHQLEGLMVSEKMTFADLKGILDAFARRFFGPRVKTRFRPSFFPFTEPSAEIDISCQACKQKGCRVCSQTGWLEVLGAGTVDPHVFEEVGYDSDSIQGFAFGLGVERLAMLLYGVGDIRLFYENDLRFLEQFG